MAFDGIYLYSLIQELKSSMINLKIDKINQPEKDEVILTLRGKEQKRLLISASSNCPRIHFTSLVKENPKQAPMFCMVMRKYLIGGKILDIYQKDTDRVVCMDVECSDELGFNSVYTLIVEIMARHSNITLVRTRDNKVMESIKHITFDMNTYRSLYPGVSYIYPPESTKVNPFEANEALLTNELENQDLPFTDDIFSKLFTGISKPLSKELFYRASIRSNFTLDKNNIKNFTLNTLNELLDLKNHVIYLKDGVYKDFSFSKFNSLTQYETLEFFSHSELLDSYYINKDKQERLNNRSQDLQKLINTNIERCKKKIKILENTLKDCESKDEYKLKGELLTSYIYSIVPGSKEISLLNYYEEEEYINITLKENKSPSENIQEYFKKYNKFKKSEENAITQLQHGHDELNYLLSVASNLNNADNYTDIEDIKNELVESGYIRFKKSKNKKSKPAEPMHFISSDGIDIYVGKNNIQNDFLTLKFASKNDLWLHAKNMPGSHVIIKTNDVSEKTLSEAATLAAYYSKGQNSSKVPIDYTNVKNVKKPSGSKPGMVIYYTNKTIYAEPSVLNLKRVK